MPLHIFESNKTFKNYPLNKIKDISITLGKDYYKSLHDVTYMFKRKYTN